VFIIIVVFMCVYYRLLGGMGHLRIETRLRDERFESEMGECAIYKF
jgi:hypothetical protein